MSIELSATSVMDLPKIEIPEIALLDYDRTLAEADMDTFFRVGEAIDAPLNRVRRENDIYESPHRTSKESFQPYTVLEEEMACLGRPMAEFHEAYIEIAGESALYDDAAALIERLRSGDLPESVFTFGPTTWQKLKIRAARYNGHTEVMPHSNKGQYIEDLRDPVDGTFDFWRVENGVYTGRMKANHISLVDDKETSVKGMPADCRGYLLRRSGQKVRPEQRGDGWPEELTVSSLDQLVPVNGRLVKQELVVASARIAMPQTSVQYVPVRSRYSLAA